MCVWLSVSVVLCVIVFSDGDETDISSSLFIKMSNLFDYNKFIMSLFNPYLTPVLREPFCESWVFASTHGTCDVQFLYFLWNQRFNRTTAQPKQRQVSKD